jgi:long-chain acyl-CoA synthetase
VVEGAPQDHPHILTPTMKIKREAFAEWQKVALQRIYG